MPVPGQGAEEKVNRQTLAARRDRFQQLQRAVKKGHVPVGWDDIGAVGLHRHPVLDLEDLHPGIALDQFGEDALVVRGQVLHQDKGHAALGVGGHAGKEGFERRQPPGRCADAHDGKALLRLCLRADTRVRPSGRLCFTQSLRRTRRPSGASFLFMLILC